MRTKSGLSKINEEILSLAERVVEIEDYEAKSDFDTREGHIVANVKVYEWLSSNDVESVISKRGFEAHKEDILEEFNEARLDSIVNHTNEWEVDYVKEKLEGRVHVNDLGNRAASYNIFLREGGDVNPDDFTQHTFYLKHYKKEFANFFKRKNNSLKAYKKSLKKNNPWDWEENRRLDSFTPAVWSWGRSGGWLSVCETRELEGEEFDYYLTDLSSSLTNKEFNDELELIAVGQKEKRKLIQDMKYFISEWEFKKSAIEYYVNEIEENKKGIKEAYLDRLEQEVYDYVTVDLGVQTSNVSIEVDGDLVKTSLGVSVDVTEFTANLMELKPTFLGMKPGDVVQIGRKVGKYFVERATGIDGDVIVKAGCHKFSVNQMLNVIK
jgi:hypothetical protein